MDGCSTFILYSKNRKTVHNYFCQTESYYSCISVVIRPIKVDLVITFKERWLSLNK